MDQEDVSHAGAQECSLNLAFNQFDADLEGVPEWCNVNTDHMYSDEYEFAQMRARRNLARPPPQDHPIALDYTNFDSDDDDDRDDEFYNPFDVFRPLRPQQKQTIYDNKQNVHDTHVQRTVSASVGKLIEMTDGKALPEVEEVVRALYGRVSFFARLFGLTRADHPRYLVARWCEDPTISSTHGVSYKELLRRVYAVVREHEDREGLEGVMRDEVLASVGVCFTGRFSRLVNVLTGFVEGVGVSIAPREHMQARIATVVAKGRESGKAREEIVKEVGAVLDEFGVVEEGERAAWLDAVD